MHNVEEGHSMCQDKTSPCFRVWWATLALGDPGRPLLRSLCSGATAPMTLQERLCFQQEPVPAQASLWSS